MTVRDTERLAQVVRSGGLVDLVADDLAAELRRQSPDGHRSPLDSPLVVTDPSTHELGKAAVQSIATAYRNASGRFIPSHQRTAGMLSCEVVANALDMALADLDRTKTA